jgi:hypothetical protein
MLKTFPSTIIPATQSAAARLFGMCVKYWRWVLQILVLFFFIYIVFSRGGENWQFVDMNLYVSTLSKPKISGDIRQALFKTYLEQDCRRLLYRQSGVCNSFASVNLDALALATATKYPNHLIYLASFNCRTKSYRIDSATVYFNDGSTEGRGSTPWTPLAREEEVHGVKKRANYDFVGEMDYICEQPP